MYYTLVVCTSEFSEPLAQPGYSARFCCNSPTSQGRLPGATPATRPSSATWSPSATSLATSPSSSLASSSSTSTAFRARASLISTECSSLQVLAVQFADRGLSFCLVGHFHESESSRFAAELVLDNGSRGDLPKGFKSLSQILLGNLTRQITYVDIHSDLLFPRTSLPGFRLTSYYWNLLASRLPRVKRILQLQHRTTDSDHQGENGWGPFSRRPRRQ
ncbi:hypothetical protein AMJ85_08365 [candidate division BRC1 bacterium SM23_51]|nr:MAG: hypothetical protein AMJ85_08365 [candidate division BRC1 bacterium SM23_51]